LFLVDAITALGAFPLPMDEWHIDGLVAGSQKAIMLPTGLSLISFSQKAWKKINSNPTARFYFDVRKELAANKKGETFFSSNVVLIRALAFVLKNILQNGGLPTLFKVIHRRALYTRTLAADLGLTLYSSHPSDSVTALNLPSTMDGVLFREHLEKKYNLTVMGGQDQLKGKIIRIGHMGFISDQDLHQTTERLVLGLNDFGFTLNLNQISAKSLDWLSQHE
jgi:aspartate aminotransferase-like enzyme